MNKLSEQQIMVRLEQLSNWQYRDNALAKTFTFSDFKEAFAFMSRVAVVADKLDHHPDWNNVYNKVSFKLNTHSAGGVTEKDFELLMAIEEMVAAD